MRKDTRLKRPANAILEGLEMFPQERIRRGARPLSKIEAGMAASIEELGAGVQSLSEVETTNAVTLMLAEILAELSTVVEEPTEALEYSGYSVPYDSQTDRAEVRALTDEIFAVASEQLQTEDLTGGVSEQF